MNNIFVYKSHLLRIPNWKNHRLVFPVVMYGCEKLNHTEGWALKNWCFWTVMLEKTLSPLYWKEIKPVNPKGNQPWIFIGRSDAEAEAPILWPPDAKNWLTGKDPDAGKDWRREEKGTEENEMVEWHHWLDGHEFKQVLGIGDGQGSLACYSPWGCRVRHDWVTELKNTKHLKLLEGQLLMAVQAWLHRLPLL